ncbi:DNA mismatch repair protein MutS [Clostridium thermosuccinogenes]|uniref:DNA mismatch repair protein MutS n=1 Tax=Clostridium thermosuccinogenes TaxID=84032 RepID=A0A2K2FP23_9CLOT|nr:MutS family DNA mismatch repair protein [Pseudoclostridium thermosuccinogenes]AUS96716.1 DNA mismatch repair protein MutS [Pseudoclostridium thermosuccinogenes]PNT97640.1 DNA mismatch repair protein MutS [Pseudoclostridium thermosuccinogenes]PNU00533.1 DNA mismatch repair protein MutS [Pseudoclostridium thermosuccinogenes]
MKTSKEVYENRKNKYDRLLQKQTKASNLLSNLRLLVMLAGFAGALLLYSTRNYILLAGVMAATLILFAYLVIQHSKVIENKEYTALLSKINEDSIKRCKGEWNEFPDDGKDFMDENHPYSGDLDIFGPGSLFQCINAAITYTGRRMLSDLLTRHPTNADDIRKRQAAIEELAGKVSWRQRFLAEGLMAETKMQNPESLIAWVNQENPFFRKAWVVFLAKLLPSATLLLLLTAWATGIIPYYIPALALAVQYILLSVKKKERNSNFLLAKKYSKDIKVYYNLIKRLENQKFRSEYLKSIKGSMMNRESQTACYQMKKLFKIADSLDNRKNAFYFVFNILTLWDYQNLIALERWKEKSGRFLKSWIEAIGTVEALSSLSILRFDNPEWSMPEITSNQKPVFEAKGMGHPLLGRERVNNDVQILEPIHTLLITGSNMSGKSTLLRAAGINLVLAYAGAPVCAGFFRASLMHVHSCMRVSDNLEKSISSFYAELLRIKSIVAKSKEGESVFFLLDEIFKGTNSIDRHMGAKVLIRKLCSTKSIGLVSTHDLELCDLEKENNAVKNYHFQEFYENGRICFDYKLRPGASTTRNAIYLMKLAGIDVEDEQI